MSSKVTMKMIAEAVGTSVGTVDRALNNRGRISADMKAQILLAAEELGYRPNVFAQGLRKETIFKLLVVVRKEPRYEYYALQQGIDDALNKYLDFGIDGEVIYTDTMSREDTLNLLKRMDLSSYSALVIDAWYPELAAFAQRFKFGGKPVVTIHMDLPESSRWGFVGPDTLQGGQLAANYIGELLRNQGALFLADEEQLKPQWLLQLKTALSHRYPDISVNTIRWTELDRLKDSDVLLLCGPVDSRQKHLLTQIRSTILCTRIDKIVHQMLLESLVSAVIYDNPYQQGYQGIQCAVDFLIRNLPAGEVSILIPPQLILRASLPSMPLPPLAREATR